MRRGHGRFNGRAGATAVASAQNLRASERLLGPVWIQKRWTEASECLSVTRAPVTGCSATVFAYTELSCKHGMAVALRR